VREPGLSRGGHRPFERFVRRGGITAQAGAFRAHDIQQAVSLIGAITIAEWDPRRPRY
jgi:hypothetical protein